MEDIAWRMPEEIFLNYWDNVPSKRKYILGTFIDAFKSIEYFCKGMQIVAIGQCAMVLRLLLEQTAIAKMLVIHPELLEDYAHHFKFRLKIMDYSKSKQIKEIREEFVFDEKKIAPLQFMDYGWLGNGIESEKNKEDALIIRAGLADCLAWKKKIFDKFSHQCFGLVNALDPKTGNRFNYNFTEIAAKLTDELCCAFHGLTGFEFIWEGEKKFQGIFRPLYANFGKGDVTDA